ncbi:uncharacterized protein LOC106477097 isoform X3 [Limulus polyphemus]|uniref:Uncharacterized protein LOC106477097 isoform X3 n=1 Tax=Limulus polyphemus TaxID=6850 RepID=A0ABM1S0H7_LIMPO|nr:uncharacterized protein LOC106477097 isoform X3 [Limulus polyphemus]
MGDPQVYPKTSGALLTGSILAFVAGVLLLISFSSPYWLVSYPETYSEFVRLGLWDVCFRNYRHPPYQYDEKFDGCHWIFSYKYQNIRDWLQPGWLIFVEAMMSIALWFSLMALLVISIVLMRFVMKLEVFLLAVCTVLLGITACLFSEISKAKERRRRANNLIYNMQPRKKGNVNPCVSPVPSSAEQGTKY